MKKSFLIFLLSLFLSGCAVEGGIKNIFTSSFDSTEYLIYTDLYTKSFFLKMSCYDKDKQKIYNIIGDMYKESFKLKNYTEFKGQNINSHKMSLQIYDYINKMKERYENTNPSLGYCKAKATIMNNGLKIATEVIGGK